MIAEKLGSAPNHNGSLKIEDCKTTYLDVGNVVISTGTTQQPLIDT
jgi:hypothetical protein